MQKHSKRFEAAVESSGREPGPARKPQTPREVSDAKREEIMEKATKTSVLLTDFPICEVHKSNPYLVKKGRSKRKLWLYVHLHEDRKLVLASLVGKELRLSKPISIDDAELDEIYESYKTYKKE